MVALWQPDVGGEAGAHKGRPYGCRRAQVKPMQRDSIEKPVVVGITGASGSALADAVIDRLLAMHVPVVATASSAARMVWREEMDESFGAALERWDAGGSFTFHQVGDLRAPIASGTYPTLGMVVVPCSMATAAAVAHGLADNLVRRAADVCIKERRRLVIVPRESPLERHPPPQPRRAGSTGRDDTCRPSPPSTCASAPSSDVIEFVAQRVLTALGVTDALPGGMRYEGPRA